MAFSLGNYLNNGLRITDTSTAGLLEAANAIAGGKEYFSRFAGNSSPVSSANFARGIIEDVKRLEQMKASVPEGEDPITYLKLSPGQLRVTGGAQASNIDELIELTRKRALGFLTMSNTSKKENVLTKYKAAKAELKKKMEVLQSNLANQLDYSAFSPEEAKAKFDKAIQDGTFAEDIAKLEQWSEYAKEYGISSQGATDVLANIDLITNGTRLASEGVAGAGVVRTASGYITSGEAASQGNTGGSSGGYMREGERTLVKQQPDGTYAVVGETTGNILEGGFTSINDALSRQTARQSGSTPNVSGAFGSSSGGYTSSILDNAGVNYNGLTESEIKDLEAVYEGAGNSSLLNDALSSPDIFDVTRISDEDMTAFLDEAREFVTGKGSAYEQTFTRAKENFERTLEFQAQERSSQVAQEKLDLAMSMEATAEDAAERGVATSEIRQKAESRLEEQAANIAASSRRAFDFNIQDYVKGTEDYLGSEALAGANIPGIAGVSLPEITPGIRGSLEREAEADVQLKAGELQDAARVRSQEILAGEGGTTLF